jgi:hypothetical protein
MHEFLSFCLFPICSVFPVYSYLLCPPFLLVPLLFIFILGDCSLLTLVLVRPGLQEHPPRGLVHTPPIEDEVGFYDCRPPSLLEEVSQAEIAGEEEGKEEQEAVKEEEEELGQEK